ncbi:unnamed protein product [Ostreobium quekettii]|uniref:Secreted protein n=1 Tax=Ostreobium quekettii TaxID=121088 RepID=A0A8S1IR51_9CHLO|nr:unnamed protein product [Ostreobium quekettii]
MATAIHRLGDWGSVLHLYLFLESLMVPCTRGMERHVCSRLSELATSTGTGGSHRWVYRAVWVRMSWCFPTLLCRIRGLRGTHHQHELVGDIFLAALRKPGAA